MDTVIWARWVGDYNDRLSTKGKSHYVGLNGKTLCGADIPSSQQADIEGAGIYASCKRCQKLKEGLKDV